jgi:hypothetical protein
VLPQSSSLLSSSATRWDSYTIAIAASAVLGVGLIGYSLLNGSAAPTPPVVAAAAPTQQVAANTTAPASVAAVVVPVRAADTRSINETSEQEKAQKNIAFDKFFVPPAGCSSPPKAKESPDCGVRYGHARMEFERLWALGQVR